MDVKTKTIITVLFVVMYGIPLFAETYHIYDDMTMDGGVFDIIHVHNDAIIDVTNGDIVELWGLDTSLINFLRGEVDLLVASQSSNANLRGGDINILVASEQESVHIYGTQFSYIQEGTNPLRGTLSGFWADGQDFSIYLRDCTPITGKIVLHEIPEPSTYMLLTFSVLYKLRKIRQ